MSSNVSMSVLLGSLSALRLMRRQSQPDCEGLTAGNRTGSKDKGLSRAREKRLPLVSFGPSGIGGEYQQEIV